MLHIFLVKLLIASDTLGAGGVTGLLMFQVRGGPQYLCRRQVLRGPQRVPGVALPQRRSLHQPGAAVPLSLRLPGGLLGGQLRDDTGATDHQVGVGRSGYDIGLSAYNYR